MFRSSTLVVAAALAAGPASIAGCERRMLDSRDGTGGAGRLGGSQGTGLGVGAGGSTGVGITGAGGGQNCGRVDLPVAPAGLDVLVAVAASASMNWDASNTACAGGCGATSKWAQATAAINTVVSQTQSTVGWGLELVPEDHAGLCTVAAGPTLAVAVDDASSMAAAIAVRTSANGGLSNGGNYATRAAVEVAASHLSTLTNDNRRVIVLLTDGVPNCPPDDGNTDDGASAVEAIAGAAAMGYPTFVVGFAPTSTAANGMLNRMAIAGGTGRTAPLAFFPVTNTSDLTDTLRTMIADSTRCVFTIPPPPTNDGTTTRWAISVAIDGTEVPHDHANGWDYTDQSAWHLQLYGPVCDRVIAATAPAVTVSFLCLLR
jgi:hypothetical protein